MIGKHTKEGLEIKEQKETIKRKDREIRDVKLSIADVLEEIRKINESNNYSDESVKRRKISELCRDTIYELRIDEFIDKKDKIIELPTNDQVSK